MRVRFNTKYLIELADTLELVEPELSSYAIKHKERRFDSWDLSAEEKPVIGLTWIIPDQMIELGDDGTAVVLDSRQGRYILRFYSKQVITLEAATQALRERERRALKERELQMVRLRVIAEDNP